MSRFLRLGSSIVNINHIQQVYPTTRQEYPQLHDERSVNVNYLVIEFRESQHKMFREGTTEYHQLEKFVLAINEPCYRFDVSRK